MRKSEKKTNNESNNASKLFKMILIVISLYVLICLTNNKYHVECLEAPTCNHKFDYKTLV